ncbi:MAG: hypothetical protein WBB26_09240 [Saprospiraceae bacterium]
MKKISKFGLLVLLSINLLSCKKDDTFIIQNKNKTCRLTQITESALGFEYSGELIYNSNNQLTVRKESIFGFDLRNEYKYVGNKIYFNNMEASFDQDSNIVELKIDQSKTFKFHYESNRLILRESYIDGILNEKDSLFWNNIGNVEKVHKHIFKPQIKSYTELITYYQSESSSQIGLSERDKTKYGNDSIQDVLIPPYFNDNEFPQLKTGVLTKNTPMKIEIENYPFFGIDISKPRRDTYGNIDSIVISSLFINQEIKLKWECE